MNSKTQESLIELLIPSTVVECFVTLIDGDDDGDGDDYFNIFGKIKIRYIPNSVHSKFGTSKFGTFQIRYVPNSVHSKFGTFQIRLPIFVNQSVI